jgi:Mg2+/Co2+ transporter CorB
MLFISVVIPVLNGLLSILDSLIRYWCTIFAVKANQEEQKLVSQEESYSNVIGFQYQDPAEEDYDEE